MTSDPDYEAYRETWAAKQITDIDVLDGDAAPATRFPTENWDEFAAHAEEDVPMLVEHFIPEGAFGGIAGRPKGGKTWLAVDLAVSIATGTPFLGTYETKQGPILYVALEGHRAALRARIAATARGRGIEAIKRQGTLRDLHISYKPRGIDLLDILWGADLAQRAADIGAIGVILDTLRRSATIRETNEGVGDLNRLRSNLAQIEEDGRALVFIHHFRKGGTNDDAPVGERMSGSGALHGAIDFGLYVTNPVRTPMGFTLEHEGRDGPSSNPMYVKLEGFGEGSGTDNAITAMDKARLTITEAGKSPDASVVRKGHPDEIAAFVAAHDPCPPVAIKEAFKITDPTLRHRRQELANRGVRYVENGTKSFYTLATPNPELSG